MKRHSGIVTNDIAPIQGLAIPALALGAVLLLVLSVGMGRFGIAPLDVVRILLGQSIAGGADVQATMQTVIFNVRLPRLLAALLVGLALAVAGTAYQGLFRNPMISPDILGASSGAGLGAACAILLGLPSYMIQVSAFLMGLAAVALTWGIASMVARGNSATLALVLTGMVVSSLCTAFISLCKYVADPYSKLPAITFWLMGGLSSVGTPDLVMAALPLLLGLIPLILLRWRLNVLAFGEEEAKALGVNTTRLRLVVILSSTLLTSSAVSIAGMVGWVGLVVPHLARLVVGPDCRLLIPAALFMGGAFMLGVDDLARCAFPLEIPLGILTSLIGAPFFIFLLLRGRKGWV